jgi:hypothetical protein
MFGNIRRGIEVLDYIVVSYITLTLAVGKNILILTRSNETHKFTQGHSGHELA